MRQSNGCGSVKNDEIFNLHLGSVAYDDLHQESPYTIISE